MTRRALFATIAGLVATRKLTPAAPAPAVPAPVPLSMPEDATVWWYETPFYPAGWQGQMEMVKVLVSVPEGFIARDQGGNTIHPGARFTSVRLESVPHYWPGS